MESPVAWGLIVLASAFAGSYLGGYLRKKGENLATHEDIDRLVDQVSTVTKATKEIEATISSDVWDRQKRWELKRDVLLASAKTMAEADEALVGYQAALTMLLRNNPAGEWTQAQSDDILRWTKASAAVDEARMLISAVCGGNVLKSFDEYSVTAGRIATSIGAKNANVYSESRKELIAKRMAVTAALRKELGIDQL